MSALTFFQNGNDTEFIKKDIFIPKEIEEEKTQHLLSRHLRKSKQISFCIYFSNFDTSILI